MHLRLPRLCASCICLLLARVDAAVDAELDCETAGGSSPDAQEIRTSFAGAAASLWDWGNAASPAASPIHAIDTVAVQQIIAGERRGQRCINPPRLATPESATSTAAPERSKCAGNLPSPAAGVRADHTCYTECVHAVARGHRERPYDTNVTESMSGCRRPPPCHTRSRPGRARAAVRLDRSLTGVGLAPVHPLGLSRTTAHVNAHQAAEGASMKPSIMPRLKSCTVSASTSRATDLLFAISGCTNWGPVCAGQDYALQA